MQRRILFGLAMAVMVAAEKNLVTTMFVFNADPQSLVASVVSSDAAATTYSINCPTGTDSNDCGMGPGMTLIAGPKTTYKMDEADINLHKTVTCSVAGTTSAVCNEGTETTTLTSSLPFLPVTITAGSIATGSASTTKSEVTGTGSPSDTSGKTGASGTTASATATAAQSTGGIAQVAAHVGNVFGGVVVAFAGALL
ncbi:hypothetical protein BDV59DRAFT_182717 [Aspergillus ambiguus]|uniref:putative GPI anchored protein n=1 Tax=Aspergillus ambiguus TaxID=176160 RepID=UPI003CCDE1A0